MIRFHVAKTKRGHPLAVLGFSYANLERLKGGEPIHIDAQACAKLGLGNTELMIYSGESEIAMARELEEGGLIPKGSAEKTAEAMRRKGDTGPLT
jgi:hypothetical protein